MIAYLMMAAIPGTWWEVDGKIVENPIFVFAEHVAGTEFGIFAAIISVLAMISMALAGILASSRFLFAMGQDKLLPPALERVHEKYETPHWPIIVTGVAMGLAIFFVRLKDVVKLASGFKIMIFIMINLCHHSSTNKRSSRLESVIQRHCIRSCNCGVFLQVCS